MSKDKNARDSDLFVPGETVTGTIIDYDRAKSMYVLQLEHGARGWLSAYEVTAQEFDSLANGCVVTAIVDRVESEKDASVNVVLMRDHEPFCSG